MMPFAASPLTRSQSTSDLTGANRSDLSQKTFKRPLSLSIDDLPSKKTLKIKEENSFSPEFSSVASSLDNITENPTFRRNTGNRLGRSSSTPALNFILSNTPGNPSLSAQMKKLNLSETQIPSKLDTRLTTDQLRQAHTEISARMAALHLDKISSKDVEPKPLDEVAPRAYPLTTAEMLSKEESPEACYNRIMANTVAMLRPYAERWAEYKIGKRSPAEMAFFQGLMEEQRDLLVYLGKQVYGEDFALPPHLSPETNVDGSQ